jgi:hypothetical protein
MNNKERAYHWQNNIAQWTKSGLSGAQYWFLYGNAKALLRVVQWILKVQLPSHTEKPKPTKSPIRCKHCQWKMHVIGIIRGAFSFA